MKKKRLTSEERDFFKQVRRVIFANPFSAERAAADLALSGLQPAAHPDAVLAGLLARVTAMVEAVIAAGRGDVRDYAGEDRQLIEYGFMFHMYHLSLPAFDELIEAQEKTGDEPCRVPFAGRVLESALQRGITHEDALRYFAMSYQIRRAFHFIDRIVGPSATMKRFRENLWNNIFTHSMGLYEQHLWNRMEDFSTMLLGETGTGKGMAAAAIGRSGFIPFDEKRARFTESFTRAFVPLNLSQYPEQLLESELFGHKKGAFTGAVDNHEGVLARCSPCGAIFLDEIGEVPVPSQIKLLQVLQERSFSPVGSHEKKRFQGRVIAATNRPVNELRARGTFRDDFYYRLCSDVIVVPPLRDRIAEDPRELSDLLQNTVLRILGRPSAELAEDVERSIREQLPRDYPWPGNVRELEQCVRRILVKREYEGDAVSRKGCRDAVAETFSLGLDNPCPAQEVLARYCRGLYERHGTYEAVARIAGLDRRTVKKYVDASCILFACPECGKEDGE